jgi:hypothetical protein
MVGILFPSPSGAGECLHARAGLPNCPYTLKPGNWINTGISQRNDVDSIREVIHQVRAKQQPEILLMTPAFGFEESDFIKDWTYSVKPDGSDYRARLMRLASEEIGREL